MPFQRRQNRPIWSFRINDIQADRVMTVDEKKPEWVAEVFPDWTTLQILESGDAYAFSRVTGKVFKLPHPDCPFIQLSKGVTQQPRHP